MPSDKLEKSQSSHSVLPFQNERVIPLERNITRRGLHVQNRPQGCIFFSPTKFQIPKVFKFEMEESVLQFLCLCFGLGPVPSIFMKLMRIPISLMRKLYVQLIIFLDDILLMVSSREELTPRDTLIYRLQNLGFLINCKPVIKPCQNYNFWVWK